MTVASKSVSASPPQTTGKSAAEGATPTGSTDAALGFLAELAAAGVNLPQDQLASLLAGLNGDALSAAKQAATASAQLGSATGHAGKKASLADLGLSQALLGSSFGAQVSAAAATSAVNPALAAAVAGATATATPSATTAAPDAAPSPATPGTVAAVDTATPTTAATSTATATATAPATTATAATASAPGQPATTQQATVTPTATAPVATPTVAATTADAGQAKSDTTPDQTPGQSLAQQAPAAAATPSTHATTTVDPSSVSAGVASATIAPTTQTTTVGNGTATTTTVTQQVFPEVVKVAASGSGTHRLVVTLNPEDLGEVRVTVVVRNGQVRVDVSTDPTVGHARDALIQGAPELRRMLEASGTNSATVTFRDLASSTTGGDAGRGQQQPFTAQFGNDAGSSNTGQSGSQSGNQTTRQADAPAMPTLTTTDPDVSAETRRPEPGRATSSVDQLI